MVYAISLSEEARAQLGKLDNVTAKRIVEKLREVAGNPGHFLERLAGREEYKLRVGDWRIIANIMRNEKVVFIRSIGHRKNIYDSR